MQTRNVRHVQQRHTRRWVLLGCIVLAVLVISLGWQLIIGPTLDTQAREVQVMRAELAMLAPFPGSQLDRINARSEIARPPDVVEDYTYNGLCRDVQQYYGAAAAHAGWSTLKALHVVRAMDPTADEFETDFHKTAAGFQMVLSVECFVHQDSANTFQASDTYTVDVADVALGP